MRLYLIGMPGAGKTTLGRGLATAYEVPFRDLDQEIVRREQRSIPDIFLQDGEAYFREREAAVLRDLVAELPNLVLATGGGTPCFHQNLELLLETGLALYLAVPIPELVRRVQQQAASRPLLAALPDATALETRLTETLAARQQFYDRAPLRCAASACSVEAVQQLIERFNAAV
ncbi:shikimate kinase [Hymenobacter taeanensis]|uniref:Shikimate kinase n=1 Tax=Hymenobacter taeanensis TaxID=2735321 RepID=A0A6M6BGT5_9BACT|nr:MULTISPECIES: shikimate kinase [Hymenobacter]QJX46463.1 shikimate kinase [Hymenobacter taeanensis]UOQ80327.1 shikimate kinase [Hymenobacter sp. 5414T-23]